VKLFVTACCLTAWALGVAARAQDAAPQAQNPAPAAQDTAPAGTATAPPVTDPAPPQEQTRPSFTEWLSAVRSEALTRGIRPEIVEAALGNIDEPMPVIIQRDRAQAEVVLPLERYISRRLTATLIRTGREKYVEQKDMLEEIAKKYGVPASIIAGVWGVESNFGRFTGVRPTVPALATLAWDPRRAIFFRNELFNALEILNRGDIDLPNMRGSWAGAMGQPQFMPSSYLQYAQDYDGDGHRDIWASPADIFASIANYLKGHGWRQGQTWGREVKVPPEAAKRIAATVARREGSCKAMRDMTVSLPLAEWQQLGVRTLAGGALPKVDLSASLVSGQTRRFLVYHNYDALLEYNCAHAYALTVAMLGERVAAPAPKAVASAGPEDPALR
jgi:membrane-bound lytic murein transglycosylase B